MENKHLVNHSLRLHTAKNEDKEGKISTENQFPTLICELVIFKVGPGSLLEGIFQNSNV